MPLVDYSDDDLDTYFEQIINEVKEFGSIRKFNIKKKKYRCLQFVASREFLKNPINLMTLAGVSAGYLSLTMPFFLFIYYILGFSLYLDSFILVFCFFLIFLILFYAEYQMRKLISLEDFDYVIFASGKKSLAHEMGHIHFHRDWLDKPQFHKGFRNGIKFLFYLNVKGDLQIEELLSKHNLNTFGILHVPFLKYADKVGDIYRFVSII